MLAKSKNLVSVAGDLVMGTGNFSMRLNWFHPFREWSDVIESIQRYEYQGEIIPIAEKFWHNRGRDLLNSLLCIINRIRKNISVCR